MNKIEKNRKHVYNLTLSAMFIAIGIFLPFITSNIREIGNMLLPMHLPVMLCGLICGWQYGLAVGFSVPLLRSLFFGMPVIFPNAVGMAFELAAYGAIIAITYKLLRRKNLISVYISLLVAMISGRIIWGCTRVIMLGIWDAKFSFSMFITNAFVTAVPGVVLQFILIPILMLTLGRMGVIEFSSNKKEKSDE